MSPLPVTKHPLEPPTLNKLVDILSPAIQQNFRESNVSITDCPDLRRAPFHLAGAGLSGDEKVADVGGQPNLFPQPNYDAKYSLLDIAKTIEMNPTQGFMHGAGAGPFHVLGTNAEFMPNLSWQGDFSNFNNQSYYAKVDRSSGTEEPVCEICPAPECALMANLFTSSGLPGPVLKVTARSRTGPKNFTDCIREALASSLGPDQPVSIGGVFVIKQGKANLHVMPGFRPADQPFKDRADVDGWLRYFNFDAPLVCLTVMHSADPWDLGLRMEHTHCFSPPEAKGPPRGGHYHYDIDGEEVEYEAYLNTAKSLYRVDRPGGS